MCELARTRSRRSAICIVSFIMLSLFIFVSAAHHMQLVLESMCSADVPDMLLNAYAGLLHACARVLRAREGRAQGRGDARHESGRATRMPFVF